MARAVVDSWIPEEFGSQAITTATQNSAVEKLAKPVPMASETKLTPRSGGVVAGAVAKGSAYGEDSSTNDYVLLTAVKFGNVIRVAEEDLNDSIVDILTTKKTDWANSYAKLIDNACLGVTAVGNGTAATPFNSVYYSVTVADANSGYTAGANLTQTGVATPATYAQISAALGKAEAGNYFDDSKLVIIAHPSFKGALRGLADSQNRPLFLTSIVDGTPDTLMGYPVVYSLGARTNATASANPTGNPLMIFGNSDFLLLGQRSGMESAIAPADSGAGFLTDEALLKLRVRRGFAVGAPGAFSVLEQK